MITYKKATAGDADNLARLRVEFLCEANGAMPAETMQRLAENNLAYIKSALEDGSFLAYLALDAGQIIATSGLAMFTIPPNMSCPEGKLGYLLNMYTFREYRRQGIATKLLELILGEARRLGCEKVLLEATDMGRPVYEKFGFHDPGSLMSYYLNRYL